MKKSMKGGIKKMIVRPTEKTQFFMERNLAVALNSIKRNVYGKDSDYVMIVDGNEGAGKSVFAMQIGKFLDPSLSVKDIHMNPEAFKKGIETAQKHKCVIYDEAYTGLSSRGSLSSVNRILVSKMMQMRQKNLFVIIVIPTIFLLDRYVTLFRSQVLFHIYQKGDNRFWIGFNKTNKKKLFLAGRKTMSYKYPFIYEFKGRFRGKYTIDEAKYREKKAKALEEDVKKPSSQEMRMMAQRNLLIYDFVIKNKLSRRKAVAELEKIGFKGDLVLKESQIGGICRKIKGKPPIVTG
jgi:ABC-type dipeptide/oligopeptide/nickel transport system ATPase component